MQKKPVIVYWLVPAKPERELFSDLIRILSHEMKGPRFEPHVTIFAAPQDRQSPKKILAKIKASRIHLHVKGIGVTSEFRKTLFVRLDSSKPLERLRAEIQRSSKAHGKAPADPPHVSLLYCRNLPAATRRELAKSVKLPFSHVVFSAIKAVRSVAPIETPADVKAWRVVATKSLSR